MMLEDKVAMVSGGSRGIGLHIARGLAAEGCHVIIIGRGEKDLKDALDEVGNQKSSSRAASFRGDITEKGVPEKFLQETLDFFGGVDILVNNVGGGSPKTLIETEDEDWVQAFEFNLFHAVRMSRLVIPEMKKRGGGSILNIVSVTAHLPLSRVFAYSATKAAVENLTKNVAREFAPLGVRVNALSPGFFPAEQNRKILDADRVAHIMRQTPMERFGEPEELIGACLLLLSRSAGSFMTGANVYVDGGFTAMRF